MDTETATAMSAISALVSALTALLSLFVAFFVYRRSSRGQAVVTWRLREPGLSVVDVLVKNIGTAPLHKLKVYVPRLEKPIILPVLSPQDETIVDTLMTHDSEQTYRVTRDAWRLDAEAEVEEASVAIDPRLLAGVKLGSRLPLTRIATIFEQLQKKVEDSPVLRDMIDRVGISRIGEEEWLLPPGVRGVLLPSPTWRRGIHEDTEFGDSYVRRKPNDEVVHQPRQTLRIVLDGTVSEAEQARIREYLEPGSTVTLHWHYHRGHIDRFSYFVQSAAMVPKHGIILERGVRFMQNGFETDPIEEEE